MAGKSKTMNVIMALRDKISKPLKNVSKAMEGTSKQLEGAKSEIAKLNKSQGYYNKKLSEARQKLDSLNNSTEDNREEIAKVTKDIERYNKILKEQSEKMKDLKKTTLEYKKTLGILQKQQKKVKKSFDNMTSGAIKSMDKLIVKTSKVGVALGGVAAGLGFKEAFDMEGYKVQLETAVKDTEKAGKLMSEAIEFANKTPFETGEIVAATALMETYGMSSKRWLSDIADMAGGTNKGMMQATEAMADAMMGEYTRMQEFGIRKEFIMAEAAKKYGQNVVFNGKGQILDRMKMQEVLQEYLQSKFKGGAEALSKTTKGMWSTVTGVTKNSLAKIVGMQENGTIRQGSMYAKLQAKIQNVVDILNKWSKDGTIETIGLRVTVAFTKVMDLLAGLFKFIDKYKGFIEPILVIVGVVYTTVKAFEALKTIMMGVNIVMGLINGTLAISPLGLVAIAVGVLVGALYLLWRHFDKVTAAASKAWNFLKKIFGVKDKKIDVNINKNEKKSPSSSEIDLDKYAQGGIANKPSIFGEAGAEIAIPLNNTPRSKNLLSEANKIIGGGSGVTVIIKGDVYGFEDFKEKVAEAVVKITEHLGSNTVGV